MNIDGWRLAQDFLVGAMLTLVLALGVVIVALTGLHDQLVSSGHAEVLP